jgi:AcrR family transcriptional regulator
MGFTKPPTVSDDYRAVDIYRKAAKVLHEKGFEATSMDDIAEAVDLTKGGLYYYIKGKKALLYAIMDFALNLVENDILLPARREEDPSQRLAQILSGHARLVLTEHCTMTILVDEVEGLEPDYREKIRKRKRAYVEFLRDTIATVLQEQGREEEIDAGVAAHSALGVLHQTIHWHQNDSGLETEVLIKQLTAFTLHGLAPRTA